jgi:hypothetical protein
MGLHPVPSPCMRMYVCGEGSLELHEPLRGRGVAESGVSGYWAAHWFENHIENDYPFTFLEEWRLHLMILVAASLEIQEAVFPYGLNSYHTKKQGHLVTLNE